MSFIFNDVEVEEVFFNGVKLDELFFNGVQVLQSFKATLSVVSNPNTVVTLSDGQTATTDATTGLATFEVKSAGTHTVTNALGDTVDIDIAEKGQTYNVQNIHIEAVPSISAGTYSANTAYVAWSNPSSYYSGVEVRYGTSVPTTPESGTNMYTGIGSTITVASGNTPIGCTKALTSGTTYYFSIFSYLTINGVKYYSPTVRSSGAWTAASVAGSKNFTSTQSFSIPAGVRSITIACVGGGGSGGGATGSWSNGGGAGGYVKTGTYSVTPGTTYTVTIGGASGTTSFGSLLSASGGGTGTWSGQTAGQGRGGSAGYWASNGTGNAPTVYSGGKGYAGTTAFSTWYGGGGGGGDPRNGRDDWKTKLGIGSGGSGGGGRGGWWTQGTWSNSKDEYNWNYSGAVGGTANTGGGGGGGALGQGNASGGSGICRISYS